MKKYTFLFFVLFIALSGFAQKRFNVGLKAGICTSQVEGDSYSGFNKVGFDGGIFLNAKFNDKWTAQFEMIFIQKGSKHIPNPDKNDTRYYYLGLNYMEVPVLLQYHLQKFIFEAGPGFGFLINSNEYDENGAVFAALPFHKMEFSGQAGICYSIYKNFSIDWRYSNSLFPIRGFKSGEWRWYNPGQRNNVLTFTLTYQFGTNTDAKSE